MRQDSRLRRPQPEEAANIAKIRGKGREKGNEKTAGKSFYSRMRKTPDCLRNTQKMITFALSNKKGNKMEFTDEERDLIEQIRNYRRAYPNGARELEREILATPYDLMEKAES